MKQKAIQLLKTETQPVALFNGLLSVLINSNGNPNLIRNYNTRGYTPQVLETLRYDVMQHLEITGVAMLFSVAVATFFTTLPIVAVALIIVFFTDVKIQKNTITS